MESDRLPLHPLGWPRLAPFEPVRTALLIIDMQRDFCEAGGYLERMGIDVAPCRLPIPKIRQALDWARELGVFVVYTQQGYRSNLRDLHPERRPGPDANPDSTGVVASHGDLGRSLVRGELGFAIIEELTPESDDVLISKTANNAFEGTDLDAILRINRIEQLILCGNTFEVCVHSTLRAAVDLGFDCLTLSDACGCSDESLRAAAIAMIQLEDGVFGAVGSVDDLIQLAS